MARQGAKNRGVLKLKGRAGWYVRLWHLGRPFQFGPFETKTDAKNFYQDVKVKQRQDRFFPEQYQLRTGEPLKTVIDRYLLTTAGKRAVNRERNFADWWKAYFGAHHLHTIQPKDLEDARGVLLRGKPAGAGKPIRPRAPSTVNRYTDWLRHLYNWAIRQGLVTNNPVKALERYPEEKRATFAYTLEQEGTLAEALGEVEYSWLRLAILTGLRQANQFSLRKEWVDLNAGLVLVPQTKNRQPRVVVLSKEAVEILRAQMARHPDSPWVFPGFRRKQNPMNPRWYYSKRFKPACLKAGIPVDKIGQCWHAARHAFGSRLASLLYKEPTIMEMGGWTDGAAVRRYIHPYEPVLREAAERLAALKPEKNSEP